MDIKAYRNLPARDRDRYDDAGTGVEAEETTEPTVLALAAALREHPVDHPVVQKAIADARRAQQDATARRAALARDIFRAKTGQPWTEWAGADHALYFRYADDEIAKGEDADWDVMREAALADHNPATGQNATWFRTGWDVARILLDGRPDQRDDEIARLRSALAAERARRGPTVDDYTD